MTYGVGWMICYALLPILANLFAAAEQGLSLAALWDCLPARFGRAGLLDDFPVAASREILAQLIPSSEAVEVEFEFGNGVVDRSFADGIHAPLAGSEAKDWQRCQATLTRFFTPDLGFDAVARINVLDGVRVYFRNGDIAHIRPSGNAPQLRIYAVSGSQARADHIVEFALAEPDGILRRLERAFA